MKQKISLILLCFIMSFTTVFAAAPAKAPVKPVDVHFIDTGNSDAILISDNGKHMLIDAGDNDDEKLIVDYLNNLKIKKLDYVVLTHPDADHSGGLDAVVKNFEIGNVLIGNGSAETKTYKDFVQAAVDKGLKPSVPLGTEFKLGNGTFKFYNQKSQAKDVNDRSLVILYKNGDHKFLFTGDAGVEIEKALPLKEIGDIDVLKVGHHGSKTSTSKAFLDSVKPEYNVICVGKDNKYGHPHKEVAERLTGKTYRTDLHGNIIMTTDGKIITVNTSKDDKTAETNTGVNTTDKPSPTQTAGSNSVVYITKTGKKYHRDNCKTLKSKIKSTVNEAQAKGLTACDVCKP